MDQVPQVKRRSKRPWPVTAISLLLLLQSLALGSLGLFFLTPLGPQWQLTPEVLSAHLAFALKGGGFLLFALLILLVAFSFLRVHRGAWLNAILLQGIGLLTALGFYFYGRHAFAYIMMVYGIGMVIYLNHAEVQAAFRTPVAKEGQEHNL